ncbi:hypothetical protein GE09DRAFT_1140415 [Coniochaeta sp. 2T2.1]|nr:hypothetical protein GE09DRAFT_1140415 [Coniochaeta sp. 2T2.1]
MTMLEISPKHLQCFSRKIVFEVTTRLYMFTYLTRCVSNYVTEAAHESPYYPPISFKSNFNMQFFLFHIVALLPLTLAAALPKAGTSRNPRSPLLARQTCPNNVHTGQGATYYTSGTSPTQTTACGTHYDVNNFSAAISVELEKALGGSMDKACQRQIWVINEDTGDETQLVILDANATGNLGMYALDLTPAAYNALGGNTNDPNDPGQIKITWYLVMGVDQCF